MDVPNTILCQEAFHDHGDGRGPGFQQQVEMIWNERPGKTACFRLGNNRPEPFQKKITIIVMIEYFPARYSPDNDMMQRIRGINAGFSRHA